MSAAWKDLERRVCRALGAQRQPQLGPYGFATGSDDDGTSPFAIEVKRSKRKVPEGRWIQQAKQHGRVSGRPWLLVVAGHHDPRPVAVLDFWEFVQLCQQAGRVPTPLDLQEYDRPMSETETPEPEPEPTPDAPDDEGGEEED